MPTILHQDPRPSTVKFHRPTCFRSSPSLTNPRISQVMLDKRHPKRSLQKNRNHSGLVGTSAPGFRLPVFEPRQKVLFHPVVLSFHLLQNCQPPGFVQGAAQCGQSNLRTYFDLLARTLSINISSTGSMDHLIDVPGWLVHQKGMVASPQNHRTSVMPGGSLPLLNCAKKDTPILAFRLII